MPQSTQGTSTRGFASMDETRQREIARKGGESVPAEKRSFSQNRALAAEAGRKGGTSRGARGSDEKIERYNGKSLRPNSNSPYPTKNNTASTEDGVNEELNDRNDSDQNAENRNRNSSPYQN